MHTHTHAHNERIIRERESSGFPRGSAGTTTQSEERLAVPITENGSASHLFLRPAAVCVEAYSSPYTVCICGFLPSIPVGGSDLHISLLPGLWCMRGKEIPGISTTMECLRSWHMDRSTLLFPPSRISCVRLTSFLLW